MNGHTSGINSLDQMRRMQISASGAGECRAFPALEKATDSIVAAEFTTATATVAGSTTMFCRSEPDLVIGWAGGAVFVCDVSQQVLLAQHPGLHASSLGVFERMHGAAESGMDATKRALASMTVVASLLIITFNS